MNIAVTGGLGTGKSTVSRIIAADLATELIDADQLCREQMLPGTEGYAEFRRVFNERYIQSDGIIDRVQLREAVFAYPSIRNRLENILHPIVRRQIAARGRISSTHGKILVVEVPLLYEAGWQDAFDICVVVYVPEQLCIQRVVMRDGMPVEQIRQILNAQVPIKKKLDYADFIVDNSGTFVSTVHQIAWMSKKLRVDSTE
ncbi:dephospho-CoA kinase [Desulfopila sp. IMCC35006]|uniref:dephospho-CoA kinase n=1 Tax=Desulfopila sp. IMCC35006 TaxID=2569542 RepID=UPI0010AB9019|nr:dephospho-CoA kinase [Desulfopila sp. IMCC35006]TKB27969.1 dephospho-CoA kinase [Desulfopila sp. IMCC35006]